MPEEYEVSIRNIFMAESPEDAVAQMAAWLNDNTYQAGYRVELTRRPSESVFIDAEKIDFNKMALED
jgi:hypothetical protein